jgi:hypothetical protein
MTQVSFTSGELMDIISSLDLNIEAAEQDDDYQLAAYYGNIQQQFEHLLEKVKEMQPENRVANLVLAA